MNSKKGFTLIELLVVIAIVGILSGFIAVQMTGAINTANDAKKKANLDAIKKALVMYGVENGGTYASETNCTIGVDCTNLDPLIQPYLPSDPEGTYVYESTGNSFTISSVLSSGYSYEYDSSDNTYSTNQPVNGACGSSNGSNLSSIPSNNLCGQGTASVISGEGPWSWNCTGAFGGSNANCATGNVPLNGVCGSAHTSNSYSTPTENLCTAGTPSAVDGSGPWSWTCAGSYTGLSPACAANISLDGTCGSSNGSNLSSIPSTNLCNQGNATTVNGVGPWDWTCVGTNGGTTSSCVTGGLPVNGNCGSSDGTNLSSIPSTNLCNQGNATAVSGSGPWTWSCNGLNTGTNDSCSANKIINGSCGTANKTYTYDITAYGADTLCTAGTTTPTTPAFPALGGSTNWTCVGANTGTTASCTASRNATPINGTCGTSNGANLSSAPSTNLCATGNASAVGGSGPWTWTCAGLNGGTTSGTCTANKIINGVCGSKNGKYAATTPTGTAACTTGTITGMTGSYSWTCAGVNGGTNSGSCATVAAAYTVTQFTTVGAASWTVPAGVISVEYLVIGGGGGGGKQTAGGGGGGGSRAGTGLLVSGTVSINVGAGGIGDASMVGGGDGGNSSFGSIVATGGGGGGSNGIPNSYRYGRAGGSGGGGGGGWAGGLGNAGSYSPIEGYAGASSINYRGGGGGGAGGVGTAPIGQNGQAPNGGNGLASSITGSSVIYAGGGGGGVYNSYNPAGAGGSGGGGAGAVYANVPTAGTDGLGGGGGGSGYPSEPSGAKGGSGIVIIKYISNN